MEIKTSLLKIEVGSLYEPKSDCYVITDENTLSDVARWLIKESSISEATYLIEAEEVEFNRVTKLLEKYFSSDELITVKDIVNDNV